MPTPRARTGKLSPGQRPLAARTVGPPWCASPTSFLEPGIPCKHDAGETSVLAHVLVVILPRQDVAVAYRMRACAAPVSRPGVSLPVRNAWLCVSRSGQRDRVRTKERQRCYRTSALLNVVPVSDVVVVLLLGATVKLAHRLTGSLLPRNPRERGAPSAAEGGGGHLAREGAPSLPRCRDRAGWVKVYALLGGHSPPLCAS